MPRKPYILTLDQGTTSSRAILFDACQHPVAAAQKEFTQIYPQAGYVEHDAEEIIGSQTEVMTRVLRESGIAASEVAAIGITNQRETTIVWDRRTGRPIHNAIVWQCRRTAPQCERMIADGCEEYIRTHTGLRIDAYFSATKVKWLLDNVPGARETGPPRGTALRYGGYLASVASYRRQGSCHRLYQRLPHHAVRY